MFESLPETKDSGGILGRRAVSTSLLAHGLALSGIVVVSLFAIVSPGQDSVPILWASSEPMGGSNPCASSSRSLFSTRQWSGPSNSGATPPRVWGRARSRSS